MSELRCACCGEIIPEGRMVCLSCAEGHSPNAKEKPSNSICASCEYRPVCRDARDKRKKCKYWSLDQGNSRTPEKLKTQLREKQAEAVFDAKLYLGGFAGVILSMALIFCWIVPEPLKTVLSLIALIGTVVSVTWFLIKLIRSIITLIRRR